MLFVWEWGSIRSSSMTISASVEDDELWCNLSPSFFHTSFGVYRFILGVKVYRFSDSNVLGFQRARPLGFQRFSMAGSHGHVAKPPETTGPRRPSTTASEWLLLPFRGKFVKKGSFRAGGVGKVLTFNNWPGMATKCNKLFSTFEEQKRRNIRTGILKNMKYV